MSTEVKKDKLIFEIIEKLQEVDPKEWENYVNIKLEFPSNAVSKKKYRGINIISIILFDMLPRHRTIFKYATFKQISARNGKLKKGAKGVPIEYFTVSIKHIETQKNISAEIYENLTEAEKKKYIKYVGKKFYFVFNIGEIENLDEINFSEIPGEEETPDFEDVLNGEELINSLIENKNLILEHAETSTAYYSPKFDKVVLPKKKYFLSSHKYYATTFHEIIHWTGHESRLNRLKGKSFGDDGYQFEELVAEIGSILINFELGILDEFINSLRYLKSWSEVGDKTQEERIKELQEAFNLSKKAVKYIKEN